MEWFGSVEAGGTKIGCLIGNGPEYILDEATFPTGCPQETLPAVVGFFKNAIEEKQILLRSIGIACFGPLDLDASSPGFGRITSTPKLEWQNINIKKNLEDELRIPVAIDTDVNGAALGELAWGAGRGYSDFVYITIGTGIGGGAIVNGKPIHGLIHPEMGHVLLRHDLESDPFKGICPYHGECWEGLANGPAIAKRWGKQAEALDPGHPAWDLEAGYIAQALHGLICTLSPQRIILGGGVMKQKSLFPLIRSKLGKSLNRYVDTPAIIDNMDAYIVPTGLGDRSGLLGGIALAMKN